MIVAVALSARAIVEAAHRDGLRCSAIDAFGDLDTRRLAARWRPAGQGALERGPLLAALRAARDDDGASGWIAGSGFEGRAEWLAAGADVLPLLGTAPADRARLDDARRFFAELDAADVPHPPVRFDAPPSPAGWLAKRAGAGGLQVRPGGESGDYWQAERTEAVAMSATFVADGSRAVVLGLNRQWTDGDDRHPYRFGGVAGPLPGLDAVQRQVEGWLQRLVPRFVLRGLGSLDFLLQGAQAEVLEINARPPASLALYPHAQPLRAHVRACEGTLPAVSSAGTLRGVAVVYAPAPGRVGAALADTIAAMPGAHDWPRPGQSFSAGDPLCSLSAAGDTLEHVQRDLALRRSALHALMENER